MSSVRKGLSVFAGAVLAFLAASASGQALGFWSPSRSDLLAAGSSVLVTWSLGPGHDSSFDEMELILSLDGGRTFPVRVTRDLGPETRSLTWRVPALPTRHARLALRTGAGGESAGETIRLVSEEFAIESDGASPLEPTVAVGGEWRTREALEAGETEAPRHPQELNGEDAVFRATPDLPDAAAPRPWPVAAADTTGCAAVLELAPRPPKPLLRLCLSRIPTGAPRRE